jgi:hypothetical protein
MKARTILFLASLFLKKSAAPSVPATIVNFETGGNDIQNDLPSFNVNQQLSSYGISLNKLLVRSTQLTDKIGKQQANSNMKELRANLEKTLEIPETFCKFALCASDSETKTC